MPAGHLQSCRRGGSEPQAAWGVLRKLHGCTNLTPKQGSIFGLRSAFLTPVGTREAHKRLVQLSRSGGAAAGHGSAAQRSCLANSTNYNPGIWTVNVLKLPRRELGVCQRLNEDTPSCGDSPGAAGSSEVRTEPREGDGHTGDARSTVGAQLLLWDGHGVASVSCFPKRWSLRRDTLEEILALMWSR